MHKSIIDNMSDDDVKEIFKNSLNLRDFYKNLGYKNYDVGNNTRKKIKRRLLSLNLSFGCKAEENDQQISKPEVAKDIVHPLKNLLNTKSIGFIGESKLIFLCSKHGIIVSKPLLDCKYDFIIDKNRYFKKNTSKNNINFN